MHSLLLQKHAEGLFTGVLKNSYAEQFRKTHINFVDFTKYLEEVFIRASPEDCV